MIPIGSDIHKRRCNFMKFEDGKMRALPPIDNTREAWLDFLSELPPGAEIAMEVSTSSYFTMSVLEEAGWSKRVIWVHTAGIDSPRRQKNDRLDAARLARKLAVNHLEPLPQAWFPPLKIRELRLRTRQRCWLAVWRAQAKNRVQGLLQMHGLRPPGSDPFGIEGRKWVGQQSLPEALQESVEQLLRLIDLLGQEIGLSEKRLQAVEASYPEIALLDTLPGVGPLLAAVIWSEVGDLKRFPSAEALVNFTGLIPSLYQSGEVKVQGHITRQGSRWLRWALVTAANCAHRMEGPLGQRYRRLRHRKVPNVAKTAVARSLARSAFGVLKHGCPFDENRWGRPMIGTLGQEA